MNIAAEKQAIALKTAKGLNYWGKRLDAKKNEIAENISFDLYQTRSRSAAVRELLDANEPVKEPKQKQPRASRPLVDLPVEAGRLNRSVADWPVKSGDVFIITSAQNNTPPHANFLKALEQYAEFRGAEILISKYLYNKNGFQNGEGQKGVKFNDELTPYLLEQNVFLNNDRFAFMAEMNILPTAVNPLTGFAETIGNFSAAVGHAQITHESVPALKGDEVRCLYSTGTVTQRNYIQQRAGQKAEGLHCYGALLVEFDEEGNYFVRQLQTMDESGLFYDLLYKVTPQGVVQQTGHIAALQYGDIHAEKIDNDCAYQSWEAENSLLDILKPKYQLIHDIHDFTSRNHHNRQSGVFLAKQYAAGRDKVLDDLRDTGKILHDMDRDFSQLIVVESNHDLALGRWLDDNRVNIKDDPANAELYYSLNAAMYQAINKGDDTFNILDYALRTFGGFDYAAIFLATDQSFKIAGVECGMHGHNGMNGSKGSPKQFRKLGLPVNTGHTHSPSIHGDVYTAGVSGSLDMGYNIGASSWRQTHLITYENGQRTLVDFKDGKFYA